MCHCLTLKTYTNYFTDKYNELVTQVNQQKQCVREGDRQANATTSNVNKIHKQQCSRDIVLEKARTRTFYFNNVRQTICIGLYEYEDKTKQTTSSNNSVSLVRRRIACEENIRDLKNFAIQI